MTALRRREPRPEWLESRSLLSALPMTALATEVSPLAQKSTRQNLALNGQVDGTWSTQPSHPDTGTTQSLSGTGTVRPFGHVEAQATLHLTGFIASGHAWGNLTLTARGGSVTLGLVGTPQRGFSGPPTTWIYAITGGTGVFAHAKGHGTVTLVETAAKHPVCPPGMPCPQYVVAPAFTMTIRSGN